MLAYIQIVVQSPGRCRRRLNLKRLKRRAWRSLGSMGNKLLNIVWTTSRGCRCRTVPERQTTDIGANRWSKPAWVGLRRTTSEQQVDNNDLRRYMLLVGCLVGRWQQQRGDVLSTVHLFIYCTAEHIRHINFIKYVHKIGLKLR